MTWLKLFNWNYKFFGKKLLAAYDYSYLRNINNLNQGQASKNFQGLQNLARGPENKCSKISKFNLYVRFTNSKFLNKSCGPHVTRWQPLAKAWSKRLVPPKFLQFTKTYFDLKLKFRVSYQNKELLQTNQYF